MRLTDWQAREICWISPGPFRSLREILLTKAGFGRTMAWPHLPLCVIFKDSRMSGHDLSSGALSVRRMPRIPFEADWIFFSFFFFIRFFCPLLCLALLRFIKIQNIRHEHENPWTHWTKNRDAAFRADGCWRKFHTASDTKPTPPHPPSPPGPQLSPLNTQNVKFCPRLEQTSHLSYLSHLNSF